MQIFLDSTCVCETFWIVAILKHLGTPPGDDHLIWILIVSRGKKILEQLLVKLFYGVWNSRPFLPWACCVAVHRGQLIKGGGDKTVLMYRNEWKFALSKRILSKWYHTICHTRVLPIFFKKALFVPKIEKIRQFSAFHIHWCWTLYVHHRKTQKPGLKNV